jgi:hypothetical protein
MSIGFPPHLRVNQAGYTPACSWINGNNNPGSAGTLPIIYKGMGFHSTDFTPGNSQSQKANGFIIYNELLCDAQPRFHMYNDWSVDSKLPYFSPALNYNADGTDADYHAVWDMSHWLFQPAPPPPKNRIMSQPTISVARRIAATSLGSVKLRSVSQPTSPNRRVAATTHLLCQATSSSAISQTTAPSKSAKANLPSDLTLSQPLKACTVTWQTSKLIPFAPPTIKWHASIWTLKRFV